MTNANRKYKHNDKVIIDKPDSPYHGRTATVIEQYFGTCFIKLERNGLIHCDSYDANCLKPAETEESTSENP